MALLKRNESNHEWVCGKRLKQAHVGTISLHTNVLNACMRPTVWAGERGTPPSSETETRTGTGHHLYGPISKCTAPGQEITDLDRSSSRLNHSRCDTWLESCSMHTSPGIHEGEKHAPYRPCLTKLVQIVQMMHFRICVCSDRSGPWDGASGSFRCARL